MIDTATVNYTLDKLTKAYEKLAPSVGQVSEKYIQFILWRELTGFFVMMTFCLLCLLSLGVCLYLLKKSEDFNSRNEPTCVKGWVGTIGSIVSGVLFIFTFCILWSLLPEFLIVYNNPEIYAIQEFIRSIR